MNDKRLLIAGCGDLGIGLAQRLVPEGWEVWGMRRSADKLPAPLKPWSGDLLDPHTYERLPAPFTHVVYTATPGNYEREAYQATYVTGLRLLLENLKTHKAPIARFLLVSSTSVYAQEDGAWVDEESQTTPTSFSGQAILEGEQLLQESPFSSTVVRFGGIYGPTRSHYMVQKIKEQSLRLTSGPTLYTNRIHRDDCVGIMAHLLTLPSPASVYLGVDHEPAPRNEFITWIATQLGCPPPPTATPEEAPKRRNSSNKRCSNKSILASGYTFQYPHYRAGYETILAQYKG